MKLSWENTFPYWAEMSDVTAKDFRLRKDRDKIAERIEKYKYTGRYTGFAGWFALAIFLCIDFWIYQYASSAYVVLHRMILFVLPIVFYLFLMQIPFRLLVYIAYIKNIDNHMLNNILKIYLSIFFYIGDVFVKNLQFAYLILIGIALVNRDSF